MNLIDDLLNAEIVNAEEAGQLGLKLQAVNAGSTPLAALYSFFLSKIVDASAKGSHIYHLYLSNREDNTEVAYAEPNILLCILFAHSIISADVYQRLLAYKIPDTTGGYLTLLHLARELTAYLKNFTVEQQLEFAKQLHGDTNLINSYGILNDGEYEKLVVAIEAGKLTSYLDFFNYSYCCSRLDHHQNKTSLQVLKQLTTALNRLMYDSFSIASLTWQEEPFNGHPCYDNRQARLSLHTKIQTYNKVYTYSSDDQNSKGDTYSLIENALVLTNDILADYAAPYRFTGIINRLNTDLFPDQQNCYVICRLAIQDMPALNFDAMRRRFLHYSPIPMFRERLSYKHIEYLIYHFRICGLFNHLSEQKINESITRIHNKTYDNADQLLAAFGGTTAMANNYDTTGQPPYLQLLTALGLISRGVLNFTNIEDQTPMNPAIEEEVAHMVKFTCNGMRHAVECQHYYGEFDESVLFHICRNIIKPSYPDLILLSLNSSDNNNHLYTLINRKQKHYLQKANINLGCERFC